MTKLCRMRIGLIGGLLLTQLAARAQKTTEISVQADQITGHVSPTFYGLMTEEINYSYDGGIYAELIRNRNFKEDPEEPVHWQLVEKGGATGSMSLDPSTTFNKAVPTALKLVISKADSNGHVGIANDGFWGIAVKPDTTYKAVFYAKAAPGFSGPLTLQILSNDGTSVRARATVSGISQQWVRYEASLKTDKVPESAENKFVILADQPGTIWFGFVSLFPPTFKNRANGNRPDIMQLLADMNPTFLRLPGGNYLEGRTVETRFDWKKTIGDVSERPGHWNDSWQYWSSDGMGLLEFLNWCEDLKMKPLLAVYAGYSLGGGARITLHSELQPYIQDALDEIEYVTGDVSTTWGARRSKDGHPVPFELQYVEIGNEDGGDSEWGSYETRFAQFFDAIKAKYPGLKLIATDPVTTRPADVIDEHYYRRSEDEMAAHADDYDASRRPGLGFGHAPKEIFVGEWATRVGVPTPNWSGTLGDAAWMVGMERNASRVTMESYAPLFTRVDPGGMQWQVDLIGYNSIGAYGSPSYYMQSMFANHHGDEVLSLTARNVPTREWQPPSGLGIGPLPNGGGSFGSARRGNSRSTAPPPPPPDFLNPKGPLQPPAPVQLSLMSFDSTRDSRTGTIFIKIVNRDDTPQSVHFTLSGLSSIAATGRIVTLSSGSPEGTNSITEPQKIIPVVSEISGLGTDFTHSFAPYSVNVLELKATSNK